MRHLGIAILALVLTGGAIASARAARVDPAYDEDRVVADLAAHEFRPSDETDVTVPVVRCAQREWEPYRSVGGTVIIGRHHLGYEGREVMPLSSNPAADLAAHSSGTTILPLAAEIEWQRAIARAGGKAPFPGYLYVDEATPFSVVQTVRAFTGSNYLVVRDVETSRLRDLSLFDDPGHSRNTCVRRFVVEARRVIMDDGVEILALDGHPDFSALVAAVPAVGWDVGIHVEGDVPTRVVAAIFAAFEPDCSGGAYNAYLESRTPEQVRTDPHAPGRSCKVRPFGAR